MSRTSSGPNTGLPPDDDPQAGLPIVPEPRIGDPLRLEVLVPANGTCTLRVRGEIDLATSPLLRSCAMEQLRQGPRLLVLDLRRVDFLGSSGLAVLIELRTEAQRRGIGLRLVVTSRAVLRPLVATGLITLFDVDDTAGS
ncbi:MAG: STAS domain-containing protein [Pseudonocardiaceae bacterium]